MNRYQKILIIIFGISLALIPESIVTSAREYQIVQALSSQQVNLRAKQITVRIDGDKSGSGIIIASSGNSYTILTSWHIVQELGEYIVQTVDGRQHQVSSSTIEKISDVDLAVFQFTSSQNYQVAELGNSNNLIEGQDIYFSGYPGELRTESDRVYRFFSANIVGLLDTPNANGYSLIYDGSAFPGMSGGPVLNEQGRLIGIHGETNIHAVTGAVSNYAIPSAIYQAAIATNDNAAATANNQAVATNDETNNDATATVPETIVETDATQQPTADSTSTETATVESESDNAAATANNPAVATNDETNNDATAVVPETVVETDNTSKAATDSTTPTETATTESENDNAVATPSNQTEETNEATDNNATTVVPETIVETNPTTTQQPTAEINPSETNSVPVFSSPQNQEQNPQVATSNNSSSISKPEKVEATETSVNVPKNSPEAIANSPNNQTESAQTNSSRNRKSSLISGETGIDYTDLQNLLAQEKWSEADRLTKQDISNIFQTIKRKNNNNPIELRTLADRACQDMSLIDSLWRRSSGDRFGFRPQQNIWNSLNQNNNFSINVWRNFVTKIGWKTGDINSAAGYILYEELDFNTQSAPSGHLPWWFDYSDEQKNAMRQVLTRCKF